MEGLDLNEIICPVCNHALVGGETCMHCGYDHSCDYEQYPTLCTVSARMPSRAGRRAQWEHEQARIRAERENKALSEQLKRELTLEKGRRAEAERQLKELSEEHEALSAQSRNQETTIVQLQKKTKQLLEQLYDQEAAVGRESKALSEQLKRELTLEKGRRAEAERQLKELSEKHEAISVQSRNQEATIAQLQKKIEQLESERKQTVGQQTVPQAGETKQRRNEVAAEPKLSKVSYAISEPQNAFEAGRMAFQAGDYAKAVNWYQRAVDQGDARAQCDLGYCYYSGRGVSVDERRAAELFRRAAKQGNAEAQYNLGCCYERGIGVLKIPESALNWYYKAAGQRDANAMRAINRLRNR